MAYPSRKTSGRRAITGMVVACLATLVTLTQATAPAAAAPEPGLSSGTSSVATSQPLLFEEIDGQAPGTLGTDCTSPFCGRVVNRTPYWVWMSQSYADGRGCIGPNEFLAPGAYSYQNPWKDIDCVGVVECRIRIDGAGPFPANNWVRISNLPWVQEVRCA